MGFRKVLGSSRIEKPVSKINISLDDCSYGRINCTRARQLRSARGHFSPQDISDSKSKVASRSSSLPSRAIRNANPCEASIKIRKAKSQSLNGAKGNPMRITIPGSQQRKQLPLYGSDFAANEGAVRTINDDGSKEVSTSRTQATDSNRSTSTKVSSTSKKSFKCSRTNEHEYLQFLLRITEDIIMNNYYKNEDIEQVFKKHVEANKNRLQMEKMELQLLKLSKELKIPYKPYTSIETDDEIRKLPLTPPLSSPVESQYLTNCECSTKRVLPYERPPDTHPFDDIECGYNAENDLVNRHSLGRVTECTEPSNSIDTIFNPNSKFSSLTVTSSLVCNDVEYESLEGSCHEHSLTEKEKRESLDEDIRFNKRQLQSGSLPTFAAEKIPIASARTDINIQKLSTSEAHNSDHSAKNISLDSLIYDNSCHSPTNSLHESTEERKSDKSLSVKGDDDLIVDEGKRESVEGLKSEGNGISPSSQKENKVESVLVPVTSEKGIQVLEYNQLEEKIEKYTQIVVEQLEKECNTNAHIKVIEKDDDYILISEPIYILRNILESKDGLIFFRGVQHPKTEDKSVNVSEVIDNGSKDTLIDTTSPSSPSAKSLNMNIHLSDYSLKSDVIEKDSFHSNYSRLLNSDYDLTPQRDSDVDKYHYLMMDKTTSISNMHLNKRNDLLLNDSYLLRKGSTEENEQIKRESCLSQDGQYELRSYDMKAKRAVRHPTASVIEKGVAVGVNDLTKKFPHLSVSLAQFDINSDMSSISDSILNRYKNADGASESESGIRPLSFNAH